MLWSDAPPGLGRVVALMRDVEAQGAVLDRLRAVVDGAGADLAREGALGAFPRLAEAHARATTVAGAAASLEAGLAPGGALEATDGARAAALCARVHDLRLRAERSARGALDRSAERSAALRASIEAEDHRVKEAQAQLRAVRAEASEAAATVAYLAFRRLRADLHRLLLASDRGIADVALVRTAEAAEHVKRLIFRRMVEESLRLPEPRRSVIAATLDERGRALAAEERKRRDEAITQLEAYVRRHPEDALYTPQALSRLAELEYQKGSDGTARPAAGAARGAPPSLAPSQLARSEGASCAATVAWYERLDAGFPRYEKRDSLDFLLGYCLGEVGRLGDAARVYRELLRRYPASSYAPEAWVRLGDLSFEDERPGALDAAIAAYSNLERWPEHPLRDHALYMLGWSLFRKGELERALTTFTKLLDRAPAGQHDGGGTDGIRTEAIRYCAESFADPKWNGIERARAWFAERRGRSYEKAVYRELGDALLQQGRHASAVEAYRAALANDPLARDAPRIQAGIVEAWARERRSDREQQERDVLLATYRPGGAWWARNGGEAVKDATALRVSALRRSAAFHLGRARELRNQGGGAASPEYRRAGALYAEYAESAADEKGAAEVLLAWAECAYGAGEYATAATLYERARDEGGSAQAPEAALGAVVSRRAEVERLQRGGALEARRVLLARERVGEVPPAEPLPPPLADWVRASDAFVERFPDHDRAPGVAYAAGETLYEYNQFPEARRRFEEVVTRWPASSVAQYAANLVVETHLAKKDWSEVEAASARLKRVAAEKNATLAASMERLEVGGRFQRAAEAMQAERWQEAAQLFTAIAAGAPQHELADKALYNAALCLDRAHDSDGSLRLYERVRAEYPRSDHAAEASYQLARAAERTYQFARAAERYQEVVERHPASPRRKEALQCEGRMLELLQRRAEAASTFARYAALFPEAEDAAAAQLRAVRLYQRARGWPEVVRAAQELERRFRGSTDQEPLVEAHLARALAEKELGRDAQARAGYAAAVAEFGRLGLEPPKYPSAARAAAEARFRLAEIGLARFERIGLPAARDPRKLEKALASKLSAMKEVAAEYEEVKRYQRPEWTIAAFYRQAYLGERLAKALLEAPIPPELRKPGKEAYLAAYQDQLAAAAKPWEEQAVTAYVEAIGVARDLHVDDEWTARIRDSLARYRPDDYPRRRDPTGRFLRERLCRRLDAAAGGVAAVEASLRADLQRDPGGTSARVDLAALLADEGRFDEAEREARVVLARDERNVTALLALAEVFHGRKLFEGARAVLDDARRAAPDDARVWSRLAFVELALGDRARALATWRRALTAHAEDIESGVNVGVLLVESGDAAAAVEVLSAAVQRAPGSATAWLDLGNACRGSRKLDEAQRAYERALALDPKLVEADLDLGLLYLEEDRAGVTTSARLELALRSFQQFVEHGGDAGAVAAYRREAQALVERDAKRRAREERRRDGPAQAPTPGGAPVSEVFP
jgi:tetratricopeptide (TPR) repeat protein